MANGSMPCAYPVPPACESPAVQEGHPLADGLLALPRLRHMAAAWTTGAPDIPALGAYQREVEPEPDVPEEPEVPELPDAPEDFDEPLPDMPEEDAPLEPELWSPARRSQPAKAMESAATTNRTCDVFANVFIVVPFIKMNDVSFLTLPVARSSSLFAKAARRVVTVYFVGMRTVVKLNAGMRSA